MGRKKRRENQAQESSTSSLSRIAILGGALTVLATGIAVSSLLHFKEEPEPLKESTPLKAPDLPAAVHTNQLKARVLAKRTIKLTLPLKVPFLQATPLTQQQIFGTIPGIEKIMSPPGTRATKPRVTDSYVTVQFAENDRIMSSLRNEQLSFAQPLQAYFGIPYAPQLETAKKLSDLRPVLDNKFRAQLVGRRVDKYIIHYTLTHGNDTGAITSRLRRRGPEGAIGFSYFVTRTSENRARIRHDPSYIIIQASNTKLESRLLNTLSTALEYVHYFAKARLFEEIRIACDEVYQASGSKPVKNPSDEPAIKRHEGAVHGCTLVALEDLKLITSKESKDIMGFWSNTTYEAVGQWYDQAKKNGALVTLEDYMSGEK